MGMGEPCAWNCVGNYTRCNPAGAGVLYQFEDVDDAYGVVVPGAN